MANIDWYVEGIQYGSCNCNYSCPCQFELLPSEGNCEGFDVFRVEKGHFGDVDLAGVVSACVFSWPGPIFEGKGQMQVVIDEQANPAQRDAMERILKGEHTDEAATHWWVFSAMSDTIHNTLIKPIEYTVDMDARIARANIPGILTSECVPIKSPVTGDEHRVRIQIPGGIEFDSAEISSASTNITADINMDHKECYGQICLLSHSGSGPVRH